MRVGVFPGSFDPVTKGHMDLIERAAVMVDHLIVGVLNNSMKQPYFSATERVAMIEEALKEDGKENITVVSFDGMLVEFAALHNCNIIFRGIRNEADFTYEASIAQVNRNLAPQMDTCFLMASPEYSFVSSSVVKEVAAYGRSIKEYVPSSVEKRMNERRLKYKE